MQTKRYFRCRTNPNAALLLLTENWEADEMCTNPEYDEVDGDGLPVLNEGDAEAAPQQIPFQSTRTPKK